VAEGVPTPAYSFSRSISMNVPDGNGSGNGASEAAEHQSSGAGVSMATAAAAAVASLPPQRWQRTSDVPSRNSSFSGAAAATWAGAQGGAPHSPTGVSPQVPSLPPAAVPSRPSLSEIHASGSAGAINATRTGSGVLVKSCVAHALRHSMSSSGLAAMAVGLSGAACKGGACPSPHMTAQVCAWVSSSLCSRWSCTELEIGFP
jgi:hypothetical protein